MNLVCHSAIRAVLQCALFTALLSGSAWAKLGGDLASVQSDALAFGAISNPSALAGATLYTQTLPNGVTVRQYLSAAGVVFAVGWEGPVLPDFERLLGMHYPTYALAVRQQKRGVSVQTADVVIESGGMMRAFTGRAYLPPSLPVTLNAQDIR